jgi:hypothetical protein
MAMETMLVTDYRIVVSPGWERPRATLYDFGVRDTIPDVCVPLSEGEAGAPLSIGALLVDVYDRASDEIDVNYRRPPPDPPLSPADAAWVDALLRAKGGRP